MRPITFSCSKVIPRTATQICTDIADVARWRDFKGYWILPGIEKAEYEIRTEDMIGARIRVCNTDGSTHLEEILEWSVGQRVVMKLYAFTPPLGHIASHFIEEWQFEARNSGTLVTRAFQLLPRQAPFRPVLWMISLLFRRAIASHLDQMANE